MRRCLERKVDQRLPVGLEHVECVIDERPVPLLHDAEARPAILVESTDFTVEDAVRRSNASLEGARDNGEALGEIVPTPARQGDLAARGDRKRPIAVPLHLVEPTRADRNLVGQRRQHRLVVAAPAARWRGLVTLPDEEPVLLVTVEPRRDQRPQSLEPLAGQSHSQAAVALLLHELVGAAVPDLDRARAVLPGRDLAFEGRVVERMVLDVDGQVALARLERDALGHRPARKRAVALEAKVIVEPPRVVALHDERGVTLPATSTEGFRRRVLPPLALVLPKTRHARKHAGVWTRVRRV